MNRERTEEGAEEVKEIKETLRRRQKKIGKLQKGRRLGSEDEKDGSRVLSVSLECRRVL